MPLKFIAAVVLAGSLAACAANPAERGGQGMMIGAGTGCAMGAALTIMTGPGALLGCGAGAAMGAAMGTTVGVVTAPEVIAPQRPYYP